MKQITALIVMTLLAGCQTTGNPTQGGLFGWSEEQAKQRQATMQSELQYKRQELRAEENEKEGLQKQSAAVNNKIRQYQSNLEILLQEQSNLKAQIEQLQAEDKLSSDRIQKIYQQNPWLNKSRQEVLDEFRLLLRDNVRQSQLQQIEQSNSQLTTEILLLIGQ